MNRLDFEEWCGTDGESPADCNSPPVLVKGNYDGTPVVGTVEQVKFESERVNIQREFDPTSYWVDFDDVVIEVK